MRTRRPLTVLIPKNPGQHEYFFSVRMIVWRELGARLIPDERRDLTGFGRTDEVEPFAPDF